MPKQRKNIAQGCHILTGNQPKAVMNAAITIITAVSIQMVRSQRGICFIKVSVKNKKRMAVTRADMQRN